MTAGCPSKVGTPRDGQLSDQTQSIDLLPRIRACSAARGRACGFVMNLPNSGLTLTTNLPSHQDVGIGRSECRASGIRCRRSATCTAGDAASKQTRQLSRYIHARRRRCGMLARASSIGATDRAGAHRNAQWWTVRHQFEVFRVPGQRLRRVAPRRLACSRGETPAERRSGVSNATLMSKRRYNSCSPRCAPA